MNKPDTLQEMENLLASIRQAIEAQTASTPSDAVATGAERASAALSAPDRDWAPLDEGDDDILWADDGPTTMNAAGDFPAEAPASISRPQARRMASEHALAGGRPAGRGAGYAGTDAGAAPPMGSTAETGESTVGNLVRPAWAMSPTAMAGNVAVQTAAPANPPQASPVAPRRVANLRLVKSEPAADRPAARSTNAASASAPSFLSHNVRQRVKVAMSRLERIEAAKRALGGEEALRQLVSDLLEPIIAEWLNDHLPDIVERRVSAEIARLRGRGK